MFKFKYYNFIIIDEIYPEQKKIKNMKEFKKKRKQEKKEENGRKIKKNE